MRAKGQVVTGPYLNVRPHHWGVEVVGRWLGTRGTLGQNQMGLEELGHLKLHCFLRPC